MAAFSSLALGIGLAVSAIGTVAKVGAAGQRAAAAESQIERTERIRREAREAAVPTPGEIKALDSLVAQRERAVEQGLAEVQRFEESVQALDPVIREASEQQLQILRGRAADILKPIRARRERQKAQLEQQLASRLGSGFRTSTAGVQALIGFDVATDELMAQTQFNALSQLGQTAQGAAGTRGALVSQLAQIFNIGTALTLGELQARGNIRQRELQSILAAPVPDVGAPGRARAEGLESVGATLQQLGGVGLGFGIAGPAGIGIKPQKTGDILQDPGINMEASNFNVLGRKSKPIVGGI